MAHIRLTKVQKKDIVRNILDKTIKVRFAALEAQLRDLGYRCICQELYLFSCETAELPANYFPSVTSFIIKADNCILKITKEKLQELSIIECKDIYFTVPSTKVPYKSLSWNTQGELYADSFVEDSDAWDLFLKMQSIRNKMEVLEKERCDLRHKLTHLIAPITTYKKLKEVWPDIHLFWAPEEISDSEQALIVSSKALRDQLNTYATPVTVETTEPRETL